ncbi:cystatin-F-like isoform X1 [Xyrauchen texanus]|uniref:cystatin-F-like isoform X1 n=1 Tax=Xyrauchen texanus TaxID=154827 RepID=UPI002242273B|nr:cystatin-F-like isoform X1 [Xyrauchen texanus]
MRVSCHILVLCFLASVCSLAEVPVLTFFVWPIPGALQNVSKNDTGVKNAVLMGTYSYNNKSNDAFLFKASAVDEAKRQIVKGVRYVLEVEISRTMCRKMRNNDDLNKCPFQRDSLLKQTFLCHFEVWSIPWMKTMSTKYFNCRSIEKL